MTISSVYDSVADFIASMNPAKILELRADPEMQKRLEELIDKEKTSFLDQEEKEELDHYIVLERLIRLAKARALLRLSQ
jgi:predicted house-cleaning noncanonical NTP pyrophosphatase (MazG superfamily)